MMCALGCLYAMLCSYLPPVLTQGDCGASYAFSAVGAIEGAVSLARGKLVSLSEQNIIDCSGMLANYIMGILCLSPAQPVIVCVCVFLVAYGNHGCIGGNMYNAYQYILANEGLDTSLGYPYRGRVRKPPLLKLSPLTLFVQQSSCYYDPDYCGVKISGSIQIEKGSEESLKAAVANAGPVAVGIDASSKAFRVHTYTHTYMHTHNHTYTQRCICSFLLSLQYYLSGVYNLPGCSSHTLTHAMVITGYGTYNGRDYWLLKNR